MATQYRVTNGNIAAIDFGTTSVSLAYASREDKNVRTLTLNSEKMSINEPKSLLIKKDGYQQRVDYFGEDAQSKFNALRVGEVSKYIYFDKIKIRGEESINRQCLVESFSGEKFYLVEVIAFILKHLKDLLINHCSHTVTPLKTTDFDWVITVPAIWDAHGKRMMREAAYLAGLLTESGGISKFTPVSHSLPVADKTNADKLSLVLKPVATAVYCQKMIAEEIESTGYRAAAIPRPSQYIVIDIGGDAVDITAHKDDGSIMEIISTSNMLGGNQVNEAFSKWVQKIVGDPGFGMFLASGQDRTQLMGALNKLIYNEFESYKCSFAQCKIEELAINFSGKLCKFYDRLLECETRKMSGVEYDMDTLYIEKPVIESQLFGPVIDGIISIILSALRHDDFKADTLYLVGGFGGSKYVHQKVSTAIEKVYRSKGRRCHVMLPPSPHLAAATGAAMWRKNIK